MTFSVYTSVDWQQVNGTRVERNFSLGIDVTVVTTRREGKALQIIGTWYRTYNVVLFRRKQPTVTFSCDAYLFASGSIMKSPSLHVWNTQLS